MWSLAVGVSSQMPATSKGRSRIIKVSPTSRSRVCASAQVITVSVRLPGAGKRPSQSSTPGIGGPYSMPGISDRVATKMAMSMLNIASELLMFLVRVIIIPATPSVRRS